MRRRGLRWLLRHGHLDDLAVHTLDTPDHAGGRSVDASVTVPGWDRHGLERLVRYCARPPLSGKRLGRVNDDLLVYRLHNPTVAPDPPPDEPRAPGSIDALARLYRPIGPGAVVCLVESSLPLAEGVVTIPVGAARGCALVFHFFVPRAEPGYDKLISMGA